jgi:hypothetical protein
MPLLSEEDVKCELSYAYLHAIAARAGFACRHADRHGDNAGVDAEVSAYGRLDPASIWTDFGIEIQLKATARALRSPRGRPDHFSFDLEVRQYNKLRNTQTQSQRILVVLSLPRSDQTWVSHSEKGLISRKCAYWVSLRGAPESHNHDSQVVHVPRTNVLSVNALREIMIRASREEWIDHA